MGCKGKVLSLRFSPETYDAHIRAIQSASANARAALDALDKTLEAFDERKQVEMATTEGAVKT